MWGNEYTYTHMQTGEVRTSLFRETHIKILTYNIVQSDPM